MTASTERAPRRATIRKKLTPTFVDSLKAAPEGDRTIIYDEIVRPLAISVTDNGAKSWILYTRYPQPDGSKRPAKKLLGTRSQYSLAEARERAQAWLKLIARGIDPQQQERNAEEAERLRRGNTFESLAEDFIKGHLKGKRQAKPVEREIRRDLIPKWGTRPITDITTDDVRRLVKAVKDRGAHYGAHSVLQTCRAIFDFGIEQGGYGVTTSPVAGIKPAKLIGVRKARQRVLDDDELRAYWNAAIELGSPWTEFYHLLALTGQRKSEVAGLRQGEVKNGLWTIPEERFKSGHVHLVPLPQQALDIIDTLPVFKKPCLLTTTAGVMPIRGFGRVKYLIDEAMEEELGHAIKPWVQHDVRRTVRTRLSELGVRYEVAELIIGHALKGLHAVYDQHKFLDERREALELWSAKLRSIVDSK